MVGTQVRTGKPGVERNGMGMEEGQIGRLVD